MTKGDKLRCILGLVDLIFAWAYHNRVSEGELHSESGAHFYYHFYNTTFLIDAQSVCCNLLNSSFLSGFALNP